MADYLRNSWGVYNRNSLQKNGIYTDFNDKLKSFISDKRESLISKGFFTEDELNTDLDDWDSSRKELLQNMYKTKKGYDAFIADGHKFEELGNMGVDEQNKYFARYGLNRELDATYKTPEMRAAIAKLPEHLQEKALDLGLEDIYLYDKFLKDTEGGKLSLEETTKRYDALNKDESWNQFKENAGDALQIAGTTAVTASVGATIGTAVGTGATTGGLYGSSAGPWGAVIGFLVGAVAGTGMYIYDKATEDDSVEIGRQRQNISDQKAANEDILNKLFQEKYKEINGDILKNGDSIFIDPSTGAQTTYREALLKNFGLIESTKEGTTVLSDKGNELFNMLTVGNATGDLNDKSLNSNSGINVYKSKIWDGAIDDIPKEVKEEWMYIYSSILNATRTEDNPYGDEEEAKAALAVQVQDYIAKNESTKSVVSGTAKDLSAGIAANTFLAWQGLESNIIPVFGGNIADWLEGKDMYNGTSNRTWYEAWNNPRYWKDVEETGQFGFDSQDFIKNVAGGVNPNKALDESGVQEGGLASKLFSNTTLQESVEMAKFAGSIAINNYLAKGAANKVSGGFFLKPVQGTINKVQKMRGGQPVKWVENIQMNVPWSKEAFAANLDVALTASNMGMAYAMSNFDENLQKYMDQVSSDLSKNLVNYINKTIEQDPERVYAIEQSIFDGIKVKYGITEDNIESLSKEDRTKLEQEAYASFIKQMQEEYRNPTTGETYDEEAQKGRIAARRAAAEGFHTNYWTEALKSGYMTKAFQKFLYDPETRAYLAKKNAQNQAYEAIKKTGKVTKSGVEEVGSATHNWFARDGSKLFTTDWKNQTLNANNWGRYPKAIANDFFLKGVVIGGGVGNFTDDMVSGFAGGVSDSYFNALRADNYDVSNRYSLLDELQAAANSLYYMDDGLKYAIGRVNDEQTWYDGWIGMTGSIFPGVKGAEMAGDLITGQFTNNFRGRAEAFGGGKFGNTMATLSTAFKWSPLETLYDAGAKKVRTQQLVEKLNALGNRYDHMATALGIFKGQNGLLGPRVGQDTKDIKDAKEVNLINWIQELDRLDEMKLELSDGSLYGLPEMIHSDLQKISDIADEVRSSRKESNLVNDVNGITVEEYKNLIAQQQELEGKVSQTTYGQAEQEYQVLTAQVEKAKVEKQKALGDLITLLSNESIDGELIKKDKTPEEVVWKSEKKRYKWYQLWRSKNVASEKITDMLHEYSESTNDLNSILKPDADVEAVEKAVGRYKKASEALDLAQYTAEGYEIKTLTPVYDEYVQNIINQEVANLGENATDEQIEEVKRKAIENNDVVSRNIARSRRGFIENMSKRFYGNPVNSEGRTQAKTQDTPTNVVNGFNRIVKNAEKIQSLINLYKKNKESLDKQKKIGKLNTSKEQLEAIARYQTLAATHKDRALELYSKIRGQKVTDLPLINEEVTDIMLGSTEGIQALIYGFATQHNDATGAIEKLQDTKRKLGERLVDLRRQSNKDVGKQGIAKKVSKKHKDSYQWIEDQIKQIEDRIEALKKVQSKANSKISEVIEAAKESGRFDVKDNSENLSTEEGVSHKAIYNPITGKEYWVTDKTPNSDMSISDDAATNLANMSIGDLVALLDPSREDLYNTATKAKIRALKDYMEKNDISYQDIIDAYTLNQEANDWSDLSSKLKTKKYADVIDQHLKRADKVNRNLSEGIARTREAQRFINELLNAPTAKKRTELIGQLLDGVMGAFPEEMLSMVDSEGNEDELNQALQALSQMFREKQENLVTDVKSILGATRGGNPKALLEQIRDEEQKRKVYNDTWEEFNEWDRDHESLFSVKRDGKFRKMKAPEYIASLLKKFAKEKHISFKDFDADYIKKHKNEFREFVNKEISTSPNWSAADIMEQVGIGKNWLSGKHSGKNWQKLFNQSIEEFLRQKEMFQNYKDASDITDKPVKVDKTKSGVKETKTEGTESKFTIEDAQKTIKEIADISGIDNVLHMYSGVSIETEVTNIMNDEKFVDIANASHSKAEFLSKLGEYVKNNPSYPKLDELINKKERKIEVDKVKTTTPEIVTVSYDGIIDYINSREDWDSTTKEKYINAVNKLYRDYDINGFVTKNSSRFDKPRVEGSNIIHPGGDRISSIHLIQDKENPELVILAVKSNNGIPIGEEFFQPIAVTTVDKMDENNLTVSENDNASYAVYTNNSGKPSTVYFAKKSDSVGSKTEDFDGVYPILDVKIGETSLKETPKEERKNLFKKFFNNLFKKKNSKGDILLYHKSPDGKSANREIFIKEISETIRADKRLLEALGFMNPTKVEDLAIQLSDSNGMPQLTKTLGFTLISLKNAIDKGNLSQILQYRFTNEEGNGATLFLNASNYRVEYDHDTNIFKLMENDTVVADVDLSNPTMTSWQKACAIMDSIMFEDGTTKFRTVTTLDGVFPLLKYQLAYGNVTGEGEGHTLNEVQGSYDSRGNDDASNRAIAIHSETLLEDGILYIKSPSLTDDFANSIKIQNHLVEEKPSTGRDIESGEDTTDNKAELDVVKGKAPVTTQKAIKDRLLELAKEGKKRLEESRKSATSTGKGRKEGITNLKRSKASVNSSAGRFRLTLGNILDTVQKTVLNPDKLPLGKENPVTHTYEMSDATMKADLEKIQNALEKQFGYDQVPITNRILGGRNSHLIQNLSKLMYVLRRQFRGYEIITDDLHLQYNKPIEQDGKLVGHYMLNDLRPDMVLISPKGEVVVVDFKASALEGNADTFNNYKSQLYTYAAAINAALGRPDAVNRVFVLRTEVPKPKSTGTYTLNVADKNAINYNGKPVNLADEAGPTLFAPRGYLPNFNMGFDTIFPVDPTLGAYPLQKASYDEFSNPTGMFWDLTPKDPNTHKPIDNANYFDAIHYDPSDAAKTDISKDNYEIGAEQDGDGSEWKHSYRRVKFNSQEFSPEKPKEKAPEAPRTPKKEVVKRQELKPEEIVGEKPQGTPKPKPNAAAVAEALKNGAFNGRGKKPSGFRAKVTAIAPTAISAMTIAMQMMAEHCG